MLFATLEDVRQNKIQPTPNQDPDQIRVRVIATFLRPVHLAFCSLDFHSCCSHPPFSSCLLQRGQSFLFLMLLSRQEITATLSVDAFPWNEGVVVVDNETPGEDFSLQPEQDVLKYGAGVVIMQTSWVGT